MIYNNLTTDEIYAILFNRLMYESDDIKTETFNMIESLMMDVEDSRIRLDYLEDDIPLFDLNEALNQSEGFTQPLHSYKKIMENDNDN